MPVELASVETEALDRAGAVRISDGLTSSELSRLINWSDEISKGRPGERVRHLQELRWLLIDGSVGAIALSAIGREAKPVRALLFDKTAANNWALGWHQDRTVAVRDRRPVAGFENWNSKDGIPHVEPPFEIIERMVTVRIHLDDVDEQNAPLRIAPGSHLLGRVPESRIEAAIAQCGEALCLARAGDVWLYRTAILHASRKASAEGRRRVLQVDYSADELPGGLEWAA